MKKGKKVLSVLGHILLILLCFIISIIICFNFIDDIVIFISSSIYVGLAIRILITFLLYFLIISIKNKSISNKSITFLFIMYGLFILSITFFKGSYNAVDSNRSINFNPLNIINDFNNYSHTLLLLIGNCLSYAPIGIFISYKINTVKYGKIVLLFIVYITIIESLQYITNLGQFDINDIILNTIGFIIGNCIYVLCKKLFIKKTEIA